MQIILLQRIVNLGKLGETVDVKPGYGRNFLIPLGKALPATAANIEKFEARRAESAELAADAILKIIDAQEETEAHLVATIRRLRAEEQVVKAKLADLNKARAYADQTNNYLPLAVQAGLPMRTLSILVGQESLPRAAAEIPDDFKPVQRAEAEA